MLKVSMALPIFAILLKNCTLPSRIKLLMQSTYIPPPSLALFPSNLLIPISQTEFNALLKIAAPYVALLFMK